MFRYQQQNNIENFTIMGKIGEGTFAEIFLAQQKEDLKQVCIKRISKSHCREHGQLSYIENQFQILTKFQTSLIPQLFYAFEDAKYVYFVLEYCAGGNLYHLILEGIERIKLKDKIKYFIQVSFAIAKLHSKGYIYRDLKPENVLLDLKGNAKLCDFGYTKKIKASELLFEICGTYEYLPPEVVAKHGYNQSYDLYCLGLFLYELLTSQNPYKGANSKNMAQIRKRKIQLNHKNIENEESSLISSLMNPNPEDRLGYENTCHIFKHKFFEKHKIIVEEIISKKETMEINKNKKKVEYFSLREEKANKQSNVLPYEFHYLIPKFDIRKSAPGPNLSSS